jgi:NitT/TauT family transport system substrate-binding protein
MLKKIVRAVDKAVTFMRENKKESIEILIKNQGFNKDIMETVWDDYVYQISLDNSLLPALEDEARWAIKNKLVGGQTIPNYLDFFYLDALKAVKPEAISIVK